jgi:hypothetical protein
VRAGLFYLPERRDGTETRSTSLLPEIIEVLSAAGQITNPTDALHVLEDDFWASYVLKAGGIKDVAEFAQHLRLNITESECVSVLDYIARKVMIGITIDHVETAAYDLFSNWFIE